jgi:hypothetical protein
VFGIWRTPGAQVLTLCMCGLAGCGVSSDLPKKSGACVLRLT